MSTTLFPQNSTNPADETDFQGWHGGKGFQKPYVCDGYRGEFALYNISGLDFEVDDGAAVINGVLLDINITGGGISLTAPDDATSIVCLKLTKSSGLVQSPVSDEDNVEIVAAGNISNIDEDYCPIYMITTSSGVITEIGDLRWMSTDSHFTRTLLGSDTVASTTALEDHPHLRVPIPGGVQFAFEICLFVYQGLDAGGIKVALRTLLNTNSLHAYVSIWDDSPALLAMEDVSAQESAVAATVSTNAAGMVLMRGTANSVSGPDELRLMWAQETSDGVATGVTNGSYMRIERATQEVPASE